MTEINDKICEIEKYLEKLLEIIPDNLEKYEKSFVKKLACERCAEIIINAVVDLAFLIIKEREFEKPDSELQAFDILKKRGVISETLSEKLQDAKRMRNILAHEYGEIDNKIVFNSLKEELTLDVEEFVNFVNNYLNNIK